MTVRAVVERIDGQMLYQAGTLTDTAVHLLFRMCMFAIGGVYWFRFAIKRYIRRKGIDCIETGLAKRALEK